MTMETTPKPGWLRIVLGFLVLSTGLSTIFTGVITAWQAWEEHLQEQWPEVTAQVHTCDLQQTSSGDPWYYIRCHLSYTVGSDRNVTSIISMNAPAREASQYPPNQIEPFEKWLDRHPPGDADSGALRSRQTHDCGDDRPTGRGTSYARQCPVI
jgi:hypothetical protein